MRINELVWLPDIVDKIEVKHHLDQDEVEQVFFNRPRYWFVERGYRTGEDVYAAAGQTDAGRYTIVFFILKKGGSALIVSARDMDARERRRHERK